MNRRTLKLALPIGGVLILCYALLTSLSPEVRRNHLRGPVTLNISGAGYSVGNVVWLSSPGDALHEEDVVLYDWQADGPKGMGPPFALAVYGKLPHGQEEFIVAKLQFRFGHNFIGAWLYGNRVY